MSINFNLNHLSMRKILLTSMLLAAVLVSSAQGQASHSKKFYVKGGYTLKGKNLYGVTDSQDPKYYDDYWKGYQTKGGNLDLGSLFYIDQLQFADQFKVGINVDYLTTVFLSTTDTKDLGYEEKLYNLQLGSAIGPVLTYQLNEGIAFDVYFKVNPIWVVADIDVAIDKTETTTGYLGFEGMKYKIGASARLDFLVLSAEFNPGSVIMQDYDYSALYYGSDGEYNDYEAGKLNEKDLSLKTPFPAFNFSIGFCF